MIKKFRKYKISNGVKHFLLFFISFSIVPFVSFAAMFEHDLFYGNKGNSEVAQLQKFLIDEKLYNGPANGNFFSLTKAAVIGFQKREGITPAVGYAGARTRARISAILALRVTTPPAPSGG